jgi:hypothetical protein
MNRDCGARGAVVIEKFAVNFVVSSEVIHVDEKRIDLDDIFESHAFAGKNVANVLDNGAGLSADIEASCAQMIDFRAGDGIIGAAGTGTGNE